MLLVVGKMKELKPTEMLINFNIILKNFILGQAPVAHACNPSYSGGRDQEDHSSQPAPGK
jgi:hypothetical protein